MTVIGFNSDPVFTMENDDLKNSTSCEANSQPSAYTPAAKVGIISCDDYDEMQLQRKIIEGFRLFGGVEKYIGFGDKVFVKPNFIRAPRTRDDPPITNPALLYSLCKIIKDLAAKPIIGDSPAFGTVHRILKKCGYEKKMRELGVKLVQLRRTVEVKRTVAGEEKKFVFSKDIHESDVLINVPKLKVHGQMGMTLAMKNIFGCVPGKRKAWRHMKYGDKEDGFARMIAETFAAFPPAFTILDGIIAMERHGPTGGDPAHIGLLLFGEDCVAIERVIAEILGIEPETLPVYRAAAGMGIGENRLEKIEIVGKPLAEIRPRRLVPSDKTPIRFSIMRVIRSTLKNIWINRIRKTA